MSNITSITPSNNDIHASLEEAEQERREFYNDPSLIFDSNIILDTSLYGSGKTYNIIEKFTEMPFVFLLGQSHSKLEDLNNRIHKEKPQFIESVPPARSFGNPEDDHSDYHVVRNLENICSEYQSNIEAQEALRELRGFGIDSISIHRTIHSNGGNCPFITQNKFFDGRVVMTFDRLMTSIQLRNFKGGYGKSLTILLDEIDGFLDGEEITIPTRELDYEIKPFLEGNEYLPPISEVIVPEGEERRLEEEYNRLIRNDLGEVDIDVIRENAYQLQIIQAKQALIGRRYITRRHDNKKLRKTTIELIPKAFVFLRFLFEHRNIRLIAGSATLRTDDIKLEIFKRYYDLARNMKMLSLYNFLTETDGKIFVSKEEKKQWRSNLNEFVHLLDLNSDPQNTDEKDRRFLKILTETNEELIKSVFHDFITKYSVSIEKYNYSYNLFYELQAFYISEFQASFIPETMYWYYYSSPRRGFSFNHYATRIFKLPQHSYEEHINKKIKIEKEIEDDINTVLNHPAIHSKIPLNPRVLLITFKPLIPFIEKFIAKTRKKKWKLGYFKNMDIRPWFSNTTHGINAQDNYDVVVLLGDPLPPHIARYTTVKDLVGNIKKNERGFVLKDDIPLNEMKIVYSSMFSEPLEGAHRTRRKIPAVWIGNFMDIVWHGTTEQHNILREILERDWIRPVKLTPVEEFKVELEDTENDQKFDA